MNETLPNIFLIGILIIEMYEINILKDIMIII